jgi:hypothetical protein
MSPESCVGGGMTARHENNNAASLLARELINGLSASEKTALGQFLSDLSSAVRWGQHTSYLPKSLKP